MRVQIKKRIAENAKKASLIQSNRSHKKTKNKLDAEIIQETIPNKFGETANISSEEFNILPRVKRPEDLVHLSASKALNYRSAVVIKPDRANPTNARR